MDVVPHKFVPVIQAYFSVRRVVVPPAAVALAVCEGITVVETRTFWKVRVIYASHNTDHQR
jgi:hypothetical protein